MKKEREKSEDNLPPKINGTGVVHIEPIVTSIDTAKRNLRRVKEWNESHGPIIRSGCNRGS